MSLSAGSTANPGGSQRVHSAAGSRCAANSAVAGPRWYLRLLCVLLLALPQAAALGQTPPDTPTAPPTDAPQPVPADAEPFKELLTGELKQAWKAYPAESLEGAEADWSVLKESADAEPILICRGRMKGFLWTLDTWQDFELTGEWKYPQDNDGNSGILVHTQREDRIWPTAVQIQLHQPKAGSIFPGGDAVTDNMLEAASGLARPINSWNECRVVCLGGRITVEINRKRAGEVTGARPAGGHVALQSEGSEVHFRRLRIRRLSAKEPAAAVPDASLKQNAGTPTQQAPG